jgi:hypothetical protein
MSAYLKGRILVPVKCFGVGFRYSKSREDGAA